VATHVGWAASVLLSAAAVVLAAQLACGQEAAPRAKEISREELYDRIRGGWTAMLIGGLEGLPHEFKYKEQPRPTLPEFPLLPDGAWSDDDNDFEWTHLYFMDKEGALKIPYPRIAEIWKANMQRGIWNANKRARILMEEGVLPPATGDPKRNEFASYNLSGQFCVESYGLIAPGMPRTAGEIGLHYARIAVSGEPLQATQYWTALVSLMCVRASSVEEIVKEALLAADPASALAEAVADALRAFHDHPDDWKAARKVIYDKWLVARKLGDNSTPTNGAMVILAILYGGDDLYKTMQYAMALGLDTDCNAATAGAVIGARHGFKRIETLPGFKMPDVYRNKTRPQLPSECKVTDQVETMMRLAERVILENGGAKIDMTGKPGYRIQLQTPALLEPLSKPAAPAAEAK